jgi:hypothetical protein
MACFGYYDGDEEAAEQDAQGPGPVGARKRRTVMNLRSLSLEDLSRTLATTSLHAFTLDELKSVTKNFSTSNFLGEGGFGPVYKGSVDATLRPGLAAQQVAVKYLDLESDGVQGHREWLVRWFPTFDRVVCQINFGRQRRTARLLIDSVREANDFLARFD